MEIERQEIVVCPRCKYGFRSESHDDYRCPREECGFSWKSAGLTEREAYSPQGRESEFVLRIVSGDVPSTHVLVAHSPVVIGRDPSCAIPLSNLQVSREHVQVSIRDGSVWAKDLGSMSGTLIDEHPLRDAEGEVQVGQHIIVGGVVLELEVRFKPSVSSKHHVDSGRAVRESLPLPVIVAGKSASSFKIGDQPISLGSQSDRDVILQHPLISPKHAKIFRDEQTVIVLDTRSRSGTFVNGKPILRSELHKGDRLQVGPFLFTFDGSDLVRQEELPRFGLVAFELTKKARREKILDSVSFAIKPGEFVGVLGPSGAGKSTLLNALNGLHPASSGSVLINGLELYENFPLWRRHIGYVPQDDIIHKELTVEAAIIYAARLRLPRDTSPDELYEAVEDALRTVRLEHRRKTSISRLSGGERKRVSVAVELVANPSLLFLDEPTAALDPGTSTGLMRTFRAMADQGRTVICTTHIMESLELFDRLIILVRGKLVFCGKPQDCLNYFDVTRFADLYDQLQDRPDGFWHEKYKQTEKHRNDASLTGTATNIEKKETRRIDLKPPPGTIGQFFTLTSRYLHVMSADRWSLVWLGIQALLVGLIITKACPGFVPSAFFTLVSCLWFGCNLAVREIIRESPIFARERMVGQSVLSYFLSKAVVLSIIVGIQCLVLVTPLFLMSSSEGLRSLQFAAFAAAALSGVFIGLLVSSLLRSQIAAVTLVPLLIIPQIVLAGSVIPLRTISPTGQGLSCVCPARWLGDAINSSVLYGKEKALENRQKKYEEVSEILNSVDTGLETSRGVEKWLKDSRVADMKEIRALIHMKSLLNEQWNPEEFKALLRLKIFFPEYDPLTADILMDLQDETHGDPSEVMTRGRRDLTWSVCICAMVAIATVLSLAYRRT